ncbi:PD40 domain-containing protein [Flagellimonas sp. S3867]|uniref:PD40 domain-containing protein n=1 Tax=Flagellimonas sp. S3867 TaxID=2768063 RepID=UPI0016881CCE|nr:PD40 domain-containing protein [Flagellimonas sp. S3867]
MGNPKFITCTLLCCVSLIWFGCDKQKDKVKFEPGNISTEVVEYSPTFTADGNELYLAKSYHEWGGGDMKSAIYHAVKKDDQWSAPKIVPFSGIFDDSDPHLSKDGNTLYFISNRPTAYTQASADIWMVTKNESGAWGEPVVLSYPINSEHTEYSPRTDGVGNLYFASDRPGGYGQGDLYMSRFKYGVFGVPVNMGNTLNSPSGEWNLEINDTGDLIIFEASQRETNISPYGDLYISFKQDDVWTIPQNIEELNTSGSDLYPFLTQDGKQLYYTSSDSLKGKNTNIYVTKFSAIKRKYRRQAKTSLEQ